jgi:hypothetical protein
VSSKDKGLEVSVTVTISLGRWTYSREVSGLAAIGYAVFFLGLWSRC